MAAKRRNRAADPVVRQLEEMNTLLMLQLINSGVMPRDIALALGVPKSQISARIPVRRLKSLKKASQGEGA